MKSLRWLLAGPFLLSLAATLFAQNTPAAAPAAPKNARGTVSISVSTGPGVGCCGRVRGVPLSADVVREFTHVLADGNRIHRETHGATFRDAEGRTRSENDLELIGSVGPQERITINDPVAGTHTTLFPHTKTATIMHYQAPGVAGAVVVGPDHQVLGVGGGVVVGNGGGGGAAGAKTPTELLQDLQRLRAEQGNDEARPRRQQISTEQLGTKEIEGFMASGTRHSRTIDADAIGNERPITSTSESWFSEDLKMVILSLNDDPQSGQRIMRLTNIRLGDPDPQLFQIPPDYTVKDIPAREEVVVKPSTPR